MKKQTICFTGHRVIREKESVVKAKLQAMLEYYIQHGYLYFAAGGARGFDTLAAEVVLDLQYRYPEISLILVLPFKNQYTVEKWTEEEICRYEAVLEKASEIIYIGEKYESGCFYKRNRMLVHRASICISYQTKSSGGTAYTVKYAEETEGIPVLNIRHMLKLDKELGTTK